MNEEEKEEYIFEIISYVFIGIVSLGLAITFFVGLLKLCIWIWSV